MNILCALYVPSNSVLSVFHKIGLYYRTIKHLKPVQIRYRLWYMLRGKLRKLTGHSYPLSIPQKGQVLKLVSGISKPATCNLDSEASAQESLQPATRFTFLNQSQTFNDTIDWNFSKYGKLWAYNLNYFDYLHQQDMSKEKGLELIGEFIDGIEDNREGLEPYPISLRGINWIKFLSKHNIKDSKIDASLYAQYQILRDNLEYHILGNHLLENGCSLLFGAFYFQDDQLWQKGKEIVTAQLEEQVLEDGGHFERSVVYHAIMLERLLDCYNLMIHNTLFNNTELKGKIRECTEAMLGWIRRMSWRDGTVPEVNDHIPEMMPSLKFIEKYAGRLGLKPRDTTLGVSGYRKYNAPHYELLVDAGNIGPDYVPGHAHSDIFSFLLRVDGREIITDTGTSTYEMGNRRSLERSTGAHNTIIVEGVEQNETWAAFRVGRRGHVALITDEKDTIVARHDGYRFMDTLHERQFHLAPDEIVIYDYLKEKSGSVGGSFHIHFYPGVEIYQHENGISGESFVLSFSGYSDINVFLYDKAMGYGNWKQAQKIVINFNDSLTTNLKITV